MDDLKEKRTFYVTRWALTKGILRVEGHLRTSAGDGDHSYVRTPYMFVRFGKDAFVTLELAKRDALEKAKKKVVQLQRALKKAEKMVERMSAGEIEVSDG